MSFNKIILVGNLGRDPELRYTPQGTAVASFSLATNDKRKNKDTGEFEDVTTWFRVTLWGKQAELAQQHLVKGRPVYIEGRLRLETYTDRDDKERTSLEVNGSDMQFIGGKETSAPAPAAAAAVAGAGAGAPPSDLKDDDVPF